MGKTFKQHLVSIQEAAKAMLCKACGKKMTAEECKTATNEEMICEACKGK